MTSLAPVCAVVDLAIHQNPPHTRAAGGHSRRCRFEGVLPGYRIQSGDRAAAAAPISHDQGGRPMTEHENREGPGPETREGPADRGPGASSGAESRPAERIVPGTGSATEGYEPDEGGTRGGDPLSGVEARPQDRAPSSGEDAEDTEEDREA
jgi:hypothetical protein